MYDTPTAWEQCVIPAYGFQWATDLVADYVQPGDRVLDVACGTGIVARCARHRMGNRGQVVGVDSSEEKIELADLCEPSRVVWEVANAERLPFRPAAFDVVLCQQGFQHFTDKRQALREMRRVLREGGRMAMSVWRSAELMPVWAAVEGVMRDIVGDSTFKLAPFAYDDPRELKRLAEEAGFANVELHKETKQARFDNWVQMVTIALIAYRGLLGGAPSFNEEQRKAFTIAIRDALRGFEDPESGVIEFPLIAHVVIGVGPRPTPPMTEEEIEEEVRIALASLRK